MSRCCCHRWSVRAEPEAAHFLISTWEMTFMVFSALCYLNWCSLSTVAKHHVRYLASHECPWNNVTDFICRLTFGQVGSLPGLRSKQRRDYAVLGLVKHHCLLPPLRWSTAMSGLRTPLFRSFVERKGWYADNDVEEDDWIGKWDLSCCWICSALTTDFMEMKAVDGFGRMLTKVGLELSRRIVMW